MVMPLAHTIKKITLKRSYSGFAWEFLWLFLLSAFLQTFISVYFFLDFLFFVFHFFSSLLPFLLPKSVLYSVPSRSSSILNGVFLSPIVTENRPIFGSEPLSRHSLCGTASSEDFLFKANILRKYFHLVSEAILRDALLFSYRSIQRKLRGEKWSLSHQEFYQMQSFSCFVSRPLPAVFLHSN